MIPTWKRLYRHVSKLLGRSTHSKGVSHFTREQSELLQLLCYVQRKLHLHGYSVPLHLHSKWTRLSNTSYLKGCECYIKNLPTKAVRLWHLAIADPLPHQSCKKHPSRRLFQEDASTSGTHLRSESSSLPGDSPAEGEASASGDAEDEEASLRDQIVEASLLAILYTHLIEGELQRALELADLLITCQNVGNVTAPERKGRRLPDLPRKDMQKLPPASPISTPIYVPYLANSCQQRAVQSLARFMALYFTNRPLYVFPPCSASPLPSLHIQSKTGL
nr:uncharacterized protein LOC129271518 [Lytechinus pictus]